MRLAIERLQRERSLTNRELAADILPLVEAFRHKRRDHGTLVTAGRRRDAQAVYLQELQPLLVGLESAIDRSVPDPLADMRSRLAGFERRSHIVSRLTALAAPTGLLLLLLCAAVLRAYRRRLTERDRAALALSQHEATTDALTGLGNRRRLLADLETVLSVPAGPGPPRLLLFDLDAVGAGAAYRLGGDEFCVLTAPGEDADAATAAAAQALTEHGVGFRIGSSWGSVVLHHEAGDATTAMQLADRRMYARKNGGRPSAGRQTRDVLLATLMEREPDLTAHVKDVAELAIAVGRRLELGPVDLDERARAAELHDIGKVAIPDSILSKPGPLSDDEWSFIRRHTIIGERILLAAPAMAGVARLVRSHHERFDGTGYPDRLAGEDIPLGAGIIAVCDAFHAMTHTRVYRDPIGTADAIAELQRQAGKQFDPAIVTTLLATFDHELPAAA